MGPTSLRPQSPGSMILLGPLIFMALAGCSHWTSFTLDQFNSVGGEEGAKKLQFYVSDDTLLRRVLGSEERGVTPGHKLVISKEKRIEEILIAEGTPGVLVGSEYQDREGAKQLVLKISFESPVQGQELWIPFRWESQGVFRLSELGGVDYGGFHYLHYPFPELKIEVRQLDRLKESRRILPGRKVSE
jgi:hypothetical protein